MSVKSNAVPILAALVSVVAILAALTGTLVITGRLDASSTPALATVAGLTGTIVSVLLLSFQAARNADGIEVTRQLMDGHLSQHVAEPPPPETQPSIPPVPVGEIKPPPL